MINSGYCPSIVSNFGRFSVKIITMPKKPLYWEASYEIVQSLIETYPDTVVDGVGIEELFQMIVSLPEFVDDPMLANDHILADILREWYEESSY